MLTIPNELLSVVPKGFTLLGITYGWCSGVNFSITEVDTRLLTDTECETANVIQLGLNHPVKATICGKKSLLFMCVDVSRQFAGVN